MDLILNQKMKIIGKIEYFNTGDNFANITIVKEDLNKCNIKLEKKDLEHLEIGQLYEFDIVVRERKEELIFTYESHQKLEDVYKDLQYEKYLKIFYQQAPMPLDEIKKEIEIFLNKIKSKVLKDITTKIYNEKKYKFLTHPAATKFHHAYIGGLSYHTLTMLKMIEPFVMIYPFLNEDLLIAGTILHDVSKIDEISGVDGEYTKEGLLMGHLVLGSIEVDRAAVSLGFENEEEVLLLKHIIISHHGLLNFGSAKKPQIPEALLLWYFDTIDSKFSPLGEELDKTGNGEFTQSVQALDKMRFYKANKK